MNKVLLGIVFALMLTLAGFGVVAYVQSGEIQRLRDRTHDLEQYANAATAELERRETLSEMFDKLVAGMDASRRANQAAFAKVEKQIRNFERTESDSDQSIACMRTVVPVAVDRVLDAN